VPLHQQSYILTLFFDVLFSRGKYNYLLIITVVFHIAIISNGSNHAYVVKTV
jgi:hypothetical protein